MKNYLKLTLISLLIISSNAYSGDFKTSAYLDTYYSYNLATADSIGNTFRVFDAVSNQLQPSFAKFSITKEAKPIGFTMDLAFGPTANLVDGNDISQHIYQAYGTCVIPIGKGLSLDAGKFLTHIGAEVVEAIDNPNYSRSFLFGYAIPFAHTGVRLSYPVMENLSVMAMLVNGWDNINDNNGGKSIGAQIAYNPIEDLGIVANFITGPEQDENDDDSRTVFEGIVDWTIFDGFGVNLNYVQGMEKVADVDMKWSGFAGMLKYSPTKMFSFAVRGEMFMDENGYRFGYIPENLDDEEINLQEFTVTADYKPADGFVLRFEFRQDMADKDVFFDADSMPTDSQGTISVGFMYFFE